MFDDSAPVSARAADRPLADTAAIVCRCGWPLALDLPERLSLNPARRYVDAVAKKDISRVDGVARDEIRARRLLRSYARLQGTQASVSVIRKDLETNEMMSFDDDTVYSYLKALREIFVIEDMPAWSPNLRSKDSVRTSDTRYFVDPSIGAAALGIGPKDLMNDLPTFGLFFETMAVRDLRVYMEALDGESFSSGNALEAFFSTFWVMSEMSWTIFPCSAQKRRRFSLVVSNPLTYGLFFVHKSSQIATNKYVKICVDLWTEHAHDKAGQTTSKERGDCQKLVYNRIVSRDWRVIELFTQCLTSSRGQ